MIKTITIRNFQSHKRSILELDPGVNVIQGSSNCGKSAILRAINWVVNNRPSGEGYVSHWARGENGRQTRDTEVSIEFDNHIVSRGRGREGNNYTLDGLTLDAIGTDVPSSVQDAINFSEVNLQSQMDPLFLLSASGGDVARFFNKIVHLDLIDKFLSGIDSKKRKNKAELEVTKQNIVSLEEGLQKYRVLEDIESVVRNTENKEKLLDEYCQKHESLMSSIALYQKWKEVLKVCEIIDATEEQILDIDSTSAIIQKRIATQERLRITIATYKQYARFQYKEFPFDSCASTIARIDKYHVLLDEREAQQKTLQDSIRKYREYCNIGVQSTLRITELSESLPKVCPTCGKEL